MAKELNGGIFDVIQNTNNVNKALQEAGSETCSAVNLYFFMQVEPRWATSPNRAQPNGR